jgi:nitroreductase
MSTLTAAPPQSALPPELDLSPRELLTTTRSVRKRLDFSRPVEREVIEDCLRVGLQAPSGGNSQTWHFVVVTDADKRAALVDIYRRGYQVYTSMPDNMTTTTYPDPKRNAVQARVWDSVAYLERHMHEAPVLVVPCIEFLKTFATRADPAPIVVQSSLWSAVCMASWNFMLAARLRGLGTCWTTLHLLFEEEAAKVLDIPFEDVMQGALIPVAYTKGTAFRPAHREPLERVLHWNGW